MTAIKIGCKVKVTERPPKRAHALPALLPCHMAAFQTRKSASSGFLIPPKLLAHRNFLTMPAICQNHGSGELQGGSVMSCPWK